MKLENQVVSIDLAKKLKELNVKQESYFYWESPNKEWGWVDWVISHEQNEELEHISAFTVAELGEMLPKGYERADGQLVYLECDWIGGKARADYVTDNRDRELEWAPDKSSETEADARAKILIYLLENKLIKQ